jgi:hypothetical protein
MKGPLQISQHYEMSQCAEPLIAPTTMHADKGIDFPNNRKTHLQVNWLYAANLTVGAPNIGFMAYRCFRVWRSAGTHSLNSPYLYYV